MTDQPDQPRRYRPPFVRGMKSPTPPAAQSTLDALFVVAFQQACPLVPIEAAIKAVQAFDGFRPETGAVASVGQAWAERLRGWEAVWLQLPLDARLVAFAFAWISAHERDAASEP